MTDAAEEVARSYQERMGKELRGAWRAGYDYLHVFDSVNALSKLPPEETFTIRHAVLPSDTKTPPDPDGYTYTHTYPVCSLPDGVTWKMLRQGAGIPADCSE